MCKRLFGGFEMFTKLTHCFFKKTLLNEKLLPECLFVY